MLAYADHRALRLSRRSSDGHRSRRVGGSHAGRSTGRLDVAAIVAVLALELAVALFVLLVAAFGGGWRGFLGSLLLGLGLGRRGPAPDLPANAREALQRETTPRPLPTRLSRSIQRSESRVDRALVRLGAKLVSRQAASATLDGTVLPAASLVSTSFLVNAESRWRVRGASDSGLPGHRVGGTAKKGQVEEQRRRCVW